MRIAITNIGKCFKVSNQDPDQNEIDDLFAVVEITYTGNNSGSLSIVYYDGPYKSFGYENYEFPYEMTGNFWHVEGFGKKFEASCEVKDKGKNTSYICYFIGGDFTNSWCSKSIAWGFVNFLNKLVQFECLEDYKKYEEANNNNAWINKDVCDKILELAKVIELYKKYYEINRALSITHEMEELINKRLRYIINQQ